MDRPLAGAAFAERVRRAPAPAPDRIAHVRMLVWLLALAMVAAAALDPAIRRLGAPVELTEVLLATIVALASLGVLSGALGGLARAAATRIAVAGCVAGGVVEPMLVAAAMATDLPLTVSAARLADDVLPALAELAGGGPVGSSVSRSMLALGVVAWATGLFAARALFVHRRPGIAVGVLLAVVYGASVAHVARDALGPVIATIAALFLLSEYRALDERSLWARRRLGDPDPAARRTRRTGIVVAVGSVTIAVAMAGVLRSAPLGDLWRGPVSELLSQVGGYVGSIAPPFQLGDAYDAPAVPVSDRWDPGAGVAFRAAIDERRALPWRATTHDSFDGSTWRQSGGVAQDVRPGDPLIKAPTELPAGVDPVPIGVLPDRYRAQTIVTLGMPAALDVPATVRLEDATGSLERVLRAAGGEPYTVLAAIADPRAGLTVADLRAAGTAYPAGIVETYTMVAPGVMGSQAMELRATILASADGTTPFDLAVAVERHLQHDAAFRYTTDITTVDCPDGVVECFSRTGMGSCLHYATTMATLLRSMDQPIPTRLVVGFLPGTWRDGVETVPMAAKHAWVEVYFPGVGWLPFDPTGLGAGIADDLPAGAATPHPSPGSSAAVPSPRATIDLRDPEPNDDPRTVATGGGGALAVALMLAGVVGVLGIGIVAGRSRRGRSPGSDASPEAAWQGVLRLARRAGVGPSPAQTEREYARALAALVPLTTADVRLVAEARAEEAYGRRELDPTRRTAVHDAGGRVERLLRRLGGPRLLRRIHGRRWIRRRTG